MPKKLLRPAQRRRTYFREWRQFRRLNQEQAAERIGVRQATLSRIERGILKFDQDFLEAAAEAYMCEPVDLLIRNPLVENGVWSISDILLKATPEEREQVRRVAEALVKKTG